LIKAGRKLRTKRLAVLAVAAMLIFSALSLGPIQGYASTINASLGHPYQPNSFNPVTGVVAYVWPGSEPNSNPDTSNSAAVLTNSTGDLIFAVTALDGYRTDGTGSSGPKGTFPTRGWTGIMIAIPPGFNVPDASQVVSSFTNDYAGISVTKVGPYDRYIPGWTLVSVLAENGRDTHGSSAYYDRQTIQFTSAGEWYYVRINGVTAPTIAGSYFFKVLLWGDSGYLAGAEGTASSTCALYTKGSSCFPTPPPGEAPTQFIPTQNWPSLLVKGEVDPATVTGTLSYGGYNALLSGQPIQEAGMVYAKMKTRIDPATGKLRPDLPTIDAMAYFNATSHGFFEIDGLAPGVYDFSASAAGYPEAFIQAHVTVLKGQSLHVSGVLQPGAVIHGDVYSKHQFGDQPWPESMYVKVELYDKPTVSQIPDPRAQLVSWSPLPCVAGGQNYFYGWAHAGQCGDPRTAGQVAFPWHEYTPASGYGFPSGSGASYYQVSAGNAPGLLLQDPMGVGPPQTWFVNGGTADPFHFEFGSRGEYGAPRDLSGMVPQVYATWVNGLTPGRYYVRVWVFRYVQSQMDGSTFQEYYFDVTPNEWAGDVSLPIDLRLSSWVDQTLHFHDLLNGIVDDPIDTGAGMMSGVLVDENGHVWSYNQTILGYQGLYPAWGAYSGGFTVPTTFQNIWGQDLDKGKVNAHAIESGMADIQFWGINDTWSGENYGIPAGLYTPLTGVLGYLEQDSPSQVSITLSGNPTAISNHMYRGAGFQLTIYSTDWERPPVNRPWVWGNPTGVDFLGHPVGQEIDVGFYNNGTLVDYLGDSISAIADANVQQTSCLYQGGDTGANCPGITASSVQAVGGGWNPVSQSGTVFQGGDGAFFGQELRGAGLVGGYTSGLFTFETATSLFAPFAHTLWLYPTAFDSGAYSLRAYTYGYVQDIQAAAYAQRTQVANLRISLVIGVNVTLNILFKKEHIITPTDANMSVRVRLFDDLGSLVAEWMSSEGTYVVGQGNAVAADGTNQYPFGPITTAGGGRALQPKPAPLNTYNFLPAGTTTLQVLLAGLPQVPPFGEDSFYGTPKGGYSAYGTPPGWGGPYFGDPVFTHHTYVQNGEVRTNACGFELDCYGNPGQNWNATAYFANSGIRGKPDYQGGWMAEVDFVNWYAANSGSTPNYNPPVSGLLMGESYNPIQGTPATSGISFTEDAALNPAYLGHSLAANHIGPYSQTTWLIFGASIGGSASASFEVDSNGLASSALMQSWLGEFRIPIPSLALTGDVSNEYGADQGIFTLPRPSVCQ
jgi:hypothetical protein